jgi:amphi-Trp domain-containing protein
MTERDVERDCPTPRFIQTLRRLADALEAGEPFRIQVGQARFTVPTGARLSIEHEVGEGMQELELQLTWPADDAQE